MRTGPSKLQLHGLHREAGAERHTRINRVRLWNMVPSQHRNSSVVTLVEKATLLCKIGSLSPGSTSLRCGAYCRTKTGVTTLPLSGSFTTRCSFFKALESCTKIGPKTSELTPVPQGVNQAQDAPVIPRRMAGFCSLDRQNDVETNASFEQKPKTNREKQHRLAPPICALQSGLVWVALGHRQILCQGLAHEAWRRSTRASELRFPYVRLFLWTPKMASVFPFSFYSKRQQKDNKAKICGGSLFSVDAKWHRVSFGFFSLETPIGYRPTC